MGGEEVQTSERVLSLGGRGAGIGRCARDVEHVGLVVDGVEERVVFHSDQHVITGMHIPVKCE